MNRIVSIIDKIKFVLLTIGQFFKGVFSLLATNILTLLVFEVVYKLIAYFACKPLINALFILAFKVSGYNFISNMNISRIITNPFSWIIIIGVLFLVSFYMLFDICCIVLCFHASYHRQKIPLLYMMKQGMIVAKDIVLPKNYRMILYLLLIIPLSQIVSVSGFVDGFSIPGFVMQFVEEKSWLYVIFIIASIYVEIVCLRWIFSFHNFTLRREKFVDASHRSMRFIKGKKRFPIFIGSIIGWEALVIALFYSIIAFSGVVMILIEKIPWVGFSNVVDSAFAVVVDVIFGFMFCFSVPLVFVGITQIYYMGMDFLNMHDEIPERLNFTGAYRLANMPFAKALYRKKETIIILGLAIVLVLNIVFAFYRQSRFYTGFLVTDINVTSHRGEAVKCPENTMPAFEAAIDEGCDMIELDVHLTADGQVVVMHDESLSRTTGLNRYIWEMNADDILQLDAGSWFSDEFKNVRVPLLTEVIQLASDAGILLNIELKPSSHNDGLAETVIDIVDAYDFESRCILSSLNYPELEDAKEYDPTITTMYITHISYGDMSQLSDADGFSVESSYISSSFVRMLHRKGKFVYVWTVNSEEDLENVIAMKPDGIVTDSTELTRDIIRDKEQGGYWMNYIETLQNIL